MVKVPWNTFCEIWLRTLTVLSIDARKSVKLQYVELIALVVDFKVLKEGDPPRWLNSFDAFATIHRAGLPAIGLLESLLSPLLSSFEKKAPGGKGGLKGSPPKNKKESVDLGVDLGGRGVSGGPFPENRKNQWNWEYI